MIGSGNMPGNRSGKGYNAHVVDANGNHMNSNSMPNRPALSGIFLSTIEKTLDKQGRVCIPMEFRQVLLKQRGDNINVGFVAFRSYAHPAIECYSIERMEALSQQMDTMDPFNPLQDDFNSSVFADSHLLMFDMEEGRIKIPPILLDHANIHYPNLNKNTSQSNQSDSKKAESHQSESSGSSSLSFVGKGTTFQIWETKTFQAHQAQARKALQDKWAKAKQQQS